MPLVADSSPAPVTYRVMTVGACHYYVHAVLTVEHTADGWLRLLGPSQQVLLGIHLEDVVTYGTVLDGAGGSDADA